MGCQFILLFIPRYNFCVNLQLRTEYRTVAYKVQPDVSARNQPGNLARNQPGSLVVLPCVIASRLGSDVEAAVNSSGIPGTPF